MSDLNAFDAASCCGCGGCKYRLCVRGCDDFEFQTGWSYLFVKETAPGETGEGISGTYPYNDPVQRNLSCDGTTTMGGLTPGHWTLTITPLPPYNLSFDPTTIEFDVDCVGVLDLEVVLTPKEGLTCGCLACGGLPGPSTECVYYINGVPLLYNESTGYYEGCDLFGVESFPYCTIYEFSGGTCHVCAAAKSVASVPVLFALQVPCSIDDPVQLLVRFPITCNYKRRRIGIFDPPTYVCSHLGAALDTEPCYTFVSPPGYGAYKCNAEGIGNPADPLTTCDNTLEFVSGLSCDWLTTAAGGGSSATPACPSDPECGARPSVLIRIMSVTLAWNIDCDADNPYEFDVTIDPDLWGDLCYCGNLGGTPGGTPIVHRILENFLNGGNVTITRGC